MHDDNPTYMLPRPPKQVRGVKTGYFQDFYSRRQYHDTKRTLVANLSGIATTDTAVLKKIMAIKVRMNFITSKDFKEKK